MAQHSNDLFFSHSLSVQRKPDTTDSHPPKNSAAMTSLFQQSCVSKIWCSTDRNFDTSIHGTLVKQRIWLLIRILSKSRSPVVCAITLVEVLVDEVQDINPDRQKHKTCILWCIVLVGFPCPEHKICMMLCSKNGVFQVHKFIYYIIYIYYIPVRISLMNGRGRPHYKWFLY